MTSRNTAARGTAGAIDRYLAALATRLSVTPDARATILEEIRGHLEEATAAGVARGLPADEAEAQAVASFGSAAQAARSFNATLPVYWDWRRMALGLLLGAISIWLIWTLVTFPFLVQMATEHHLLNLWSTTPGALLFTAAPLSFGIFYVIGGEGPWAALLIVLLFGAVAFALGSRASHGWRAGLAFGLGVIVGLPFLFLIFFFHDGNVEPLRTLPFLILIWLLAPYAVFAAWLGARLARARDAHTLGRPPTAASATRDGVPPWRGLRRLPVTVTIGLALVAVLLVVNGWSFVRAAAIPPVAAVPIEQQFAAAQQQVSFTIRQPGYLPAGFTLTSVSVAQAWCGACSIDLMYRDAHGVWLSVSEIPHNPASGSPTGSAASDSQSPICNCVTVTPGYVANRSDSLAPPPQPTSPDDPNALSVVSAGEIQPLWWLASIETDFNESNLSWDDGTLEYFIGVQAPQTASSISVAELRQVAHSLH